MLTPSNQVGGALPGLTLKAWALVAANGTIIRQFNVAAVVKGAAGTYSPTFTAAMTQASYLVRVTGHYPAGTVPTVPFGYCTNAQLVGGFSYLVSSSGVAIDCITFFEVYE